MLIFRLIVVTKILLRTTPRYRYHWRMSNVRETSESVSLFVLGARLGSDEFATYLRNLDDALAGEEPFAMVVDGSDPRLEVVDPPNKRWQLSRAIAIGKLHRGIAFVTGSMTRERVQALYALQPPGVPYAFFTDRTEAIEWAHAAVDGERRAVGQRQTVPLMTAVSS
jgi:hypothetical protein